MRIPNLARWVALVGVVVGIPCAGRLEANPSQAPADYAVHEWGTFTSIQGSDGKPIPWEPFGPVTDLPGFVFNRQIPTRNPEVRRRHAFQFSQLDLKGSGAWLQRMETPVIYFHAPESLVVDVRVDFPQGLLTEWFPQVSSFGPIFGVEEGVPKTTASHLRWSRVRVLSRTDSDEGAQTESLPSEAQPSHYFAARQTRANLVEATQPFATESELQRDRFLFYRGAGNFAAPLSARIKADDRTLLLNNTGPEPLGPLVAVRVRNGRTAFTPLGMLPAGASLATGLPDCVSEESSGALAVAVTDALSRAGLDPDESEAMVNTWRDSWFGENGVRILYLLPQPWTERTLPLQLSPAPKDVVRVMVGRAEIFTRAEESRIAQHIAQYLDGETGWAVASLRALDHGRFLEAGITRGAQTIRHAATSALLACRALSAVGPNANPNSNFSLSDEAWNRRINELKGAIRLAEASDVSQVAGTVSVP